MADDKETTEIEEPDGPPEPNETLRLETITEYDISPINEDEDDGSNLQ